MFIDSGSLAELHIACWGSVAYLVMSPVVIKRRSRRKTSTAADLKMPPPPARGFTPAASFVFDSPCTDPEIDACPGKDALTFAGLTDCIGWVEGGHASVLLHAVDTHNLSVVAVTVKLAAT